MTASEHRSERLTFFLSTPPCLLLGIPPDRDQVRSRACYMFSPIRLIKSVRGWYEMTLLTLLKRRVYRIVNIVLYGDNKGVCTATTVYGVITGIYRPSTPPNPTALQGGIPGRARTHTHTHTLFCTVLKHTISLTFTDMLSFVNFHHHHHNHHFLFSVGPEDIFCQTILRRHTPFSQ